MQRSTIHSSHGNQRGFSVIEVVTALLVLGILVAVSVNSVVGYQSGARDRERASDVSVIAQNIERYYRTNAIAIGASYPPTTEGAGGLTAIIDEPDATAAPQQSTSSIVIAGSASAQTPTVSQYVYQPLNVDNTLCSSAPCAKYKLYFRLEKNNQVIVRDSLRQQ